MIFIGIIQGDCLSAVLFIFYLSKALTPTETPIKNEHTYAINTFTHIKWKEYIQEQNLFTISPKYADGITWASTSIEVINMIKENVPTMLQSFDLQINQNQTEEHAIPYPYKPPALNEHNY